MKTFRDKLETLLISDI